MPAVLEIDDGAVVWWESPDIWVVPGTDPLGPVGTPVAGRTAYVWARVHNRGDVDVLSAQVDYWWSNPTTGVTRALSTKIGSAFVDVTAGGVEEVLCLVPWVPTFVNGGHECLVCEILSPLDPLPLPLQDDFDPPTFHQIGQRNLSVLAVAAMVLSVQIGIGSRTDRTQIRLRVDVGGELDKAALATLGLAKWRTAKEPLVAAGLAGSSACGSPHDAELVVDVERGAVSGAFVHIEPIQAGKAGTYTVVRVRQGESASGPGITYVVCGGGGPEGSPGGGAREKNGGGHDA